MKLRMKSAVAGASALAIAGAGLALAVPASAYTGTGTGAYAGAPSWVQTDAARKGSVLFYDANGSQITGGDNIQAVGAVSGSQGWLAVKNGDGSVTNLGPGSGATKTNAFVAAPDPGNPNISTWSTNSITPTNFTFSPVPSGTPAGVSANPAFLRMNALGAAFQDVASGVVQYQGSNSDYKYILEIRVKDTVDSTHYWATDIEYNPVAGTVASASQPASVPAPGYDGLLPGQWKVVWPSIPVTATTVTGLSSSAGNSLAVGSPTDLSATVAPSGVGGTVVFKDGTTTLTGTGPVSYNSATGVASLPGVSLAGSGTPGVDQSHSITAQFVPTPYTTFSGSTSAALGVTVTTPKGVTTTTLTLSGLTSGAVTKPNAVSASAAVTWNNSGSQASVGSVGSVQFVVDGSNYGSPVGVVGGTASLNISTSSLTASDTPGTSHTVSAVYTDGNTYNGSSSAGATFNLLKPSFNSDVQGLETAVNPGTITISTPYDNDPTKATYCAVDQNTDATHVATFGKVVWTAAAVSAHIPNAVAGAPLPVWQDQKPATLGGSPTNNPYVDPISNATQQDTTPCGFLFVPALKLNGTASLYSASATFNGISVTDTRPGNNSYTLNALASDLTNPAGTTADYVINAQNIGLTNLQLVSTNVLSPFNTFVGGKTPGTAGQPGTGASTGENYTGYDNPAAVGVSADGGSKGLGGTTGHQVLHANRGLGTIVTEGVVTINAPTNTRDGVYAGTLTFTVLGS